MMKRVAGFVVLLLGAMMAVAVPASGQLGEMDLLTALELGLVRGEFRGNGDESVIGRLWAAPQGPQRLTVSPGTQFWAQAGGLQGMTSLGSPTIAFGPDRYAEVTIATACTNIGLPAPTRRHLMIATPCPDQRVARLAALVGRPGVHPAAVQVAIWAVANNPPLQPVQRYLKRVVKAAKKNDPQTKITEASILVSAAQLLRRTNIQPERFRMFR